MESPSFYAIIPANVRYDKDLKANEKLLYGEITCLTHQTGECWASNKYFSELYGVTPRAIQTWLGNLKDKGYIKIDLIYKQGTKEVEKRIIRLGGEENFVTPHEENFVTPHEENFVDNNTSINNTSINNIYSPAQKGKCIFPKGQMEMTKKETKRFTPPTVDEVKAYCRERNNNIDAEYFVDYYEARNWELNKGRKVKDWKACVRTWEHNNFNRNGKKTNIETNQSFGDELTRSQDDLCRMIGFNV